jgi:hypothetical protein
MIGKWSDDALLGHTEAETAVTFCRFTPSLSRNDQTPAVQVADGRFPLG